MGRKTVFCADRRACAEVLEQKVPWLVLDTVLSPRWQEGAQKRPTHGMS